MAFASELSAPPVLPARAAACALPALLAALREALGTAPAGGLALPPPDDAAGWAEFAAGVRAHRVGAFLDRRLPAGRAAQLPAAARAVLQEATAMAAFQSGRQLEALRRLGPKFVAAEVEAILVKGPLLAERLYGDAALRLSNDLDVLVAPAAVERAEAVLQASGYARTRPDFSLTPRQQRTYRRVQYEFAYFSRAEGLQLELLWRLEGLSPRADVWRDAPLALPAGGAWRTLPETINAFYLCLHGARHGWCRLAWLLDVALLFRGPPLPWAEVLALARAQGAERLVWQAARLVEQLLGVPPPAALRVPAAAEREIAWLAREACRQMNVTAAQERRLGEWLRQLRYRVRLQRGWRARAVVLRPHVHSLASWKTLRLPDRWFWLYLPLTPVLWLWRRRRSAR
jgi:hypothetical protein